MLKFIETIDTQRFDEMISSARERIYLSLPNIFEEFAKSLINAKSTVDDIRIVMDISENNFRHGYGSIEAVESLKTQGIKIFECSKNRISFIICDDNAYFIFPESRIFAFEDIGTNAVKMDPITQAHLIEYFFPSPAIKVIPTKEKAENATEKYVQFVEETIADIENPQTDVKVVPLNENKFEIVKEEIKKNPPTHPDLQRQIQVYTAKIQFAEMEFEGANLQFKKVNIPPSAMPFQDEKIKKALETKMRLFTDLEANDNFKDFYNLKDEIKTLRNEFCFPITCRKKSIIKNDKKAAFQKQITALQEKISSLNKTIPMHLDAEILASKKRIKEELRTFLKANPPKKIQGYQQSLFEDKIDDMISSILNQIKYPDPSDIVKKLALSVNFYDLTFEDFKDDDFLKELENKKLIEKGETDQIVKFRKAFEAAKIEENLKN